MPDTLVKLELICCEINCYATNAMESYTFLYKRDQMNKEKNSDSDDEDFDNYNNSSNVSQQYQSLFRKMTGKNKKIKKNKK